MFRLALVTARRNLGKYLIPILVLAAAVVISSLGLSGAALLWRYSQYPIYQVFGGELIILHSSTPLRSQRGGIFTDQFFTVFPSEEVIKTVAETLPAAQVTKTLFTAGIVPCWGNRVTVWPLMGRLDTTGRWLYKPRVLQGSNILTGESAEAWVWGPSTDDGKSMFGDPGTKLELRAAQFKQGNQWDVTSGQEYLYTLKGTYGMPYANLALWAPLETVQAHCGAPGLVSWIGVACANPLQVDGDRDKLGVELSARFPELKVVTAEELAEMLVADLSKLRETARYYLPLLVLVSCLSIVATTMAISRSRRRELALLRVIGLSNNEVRLLFLAECCLIGLLGGVLGVAIASGVSLLLFKACILTHEPFAVSFLVSLVTGAVFSCTAIRDVTVTESMRNP